GDVGGDERIAVAVAADPRSDAEERGNGLRAALAIEGVERVLDRAVEARQLAEKRVVVIGEAVEDLVDHLQAGLAQHVGAPENEYGASQALLVERELRRLAEPVALVEVSGDVELARQRALAAHFGRMGG